MFICNGIASEDAIMIPVSNYFAGAAAAAILVVSAGLAHAADIVDTTASAGNLTTLVAAVKAAGLVEALKGPGPLTVFAPTDAAFAALPGGKVKTLLKPENKAGLVSVLTYHLPPGRVMSTGIADKVLDAKTVEGQTLAIDATGAAVKINDATVTKADIGTDNGVIHVVDKVLLPK